MTKVSQVLPITWLAHAERTNMRGHTASQSPAISRQPPREFRDISISLLVPRRVSRNHRNVQKNRCQIHPRRSKSIRKMDPKSTQNGAQEMPGGHPAPSWGLPEAGPGRFSDTTEDLWKKKRLLGDVREALGDPEGPQGSTKNRLVAGRTRSKH